MNEIKTTKPDAPNQIYQDNRTYQTKPTEPNLPNQTSQAKRNQTNPRKVEHIIRQHLSDTWKLVGWMNGMI